MAEAVAAQMDHATGSLTVDKDDHIWVFDCSRQIMPDESGASTTPPCTNFRVAGPAVLEFDTDGNLLRGWGGPGYVPGWLREQTVNTYVFIADAANDRVWIVNRKDGVTVGSVGDNGRMAGQFHFIDGVAADSHGNIYNGEVETGKRIQRFIPIN